MRLIDPKMSIDTIKSYIEVWDCKGCLPYGETQHNVMAVDDLQYLPTIEAEPVRYARKQPLSKHYERPVFDNECSECGAMCFNDDKYCAECGAKFDEPVNGGADNG